MAFPAFNGSFVDHSPGQVVCQQYYGVWSESHSCDNAIEKLRRGPEVMTYSTTSMSRAGTLPFYVESGECMIQVEAAGPSHLAQFQISPDTIRGMAEQIIHTCVEEPSQNGGFLTSSMDGLLDWITSTDTDLNGYYPQQTSFLTVTVSSHFTDWVAPGNFDPMIAHVLAQAEFAAIKKAPSGSPLRDKLRRRGDRFLRQELNMEPRGRRTAWWEDPGTTVPRRKPGRNTTLVKAKVDLETAISTNELKVA